MTWLDGSPPIYLAGGGWTVPSVPYVAPVPVALPPPKKMGRPFTPKTPRCCLWCGETFTPKYRAKARYCSKSCGLRQGHASGQRGDANTSLRTAAIAAGLSPLRVYNRLWRGWTREKALSTPVRGRGPTGRPFNGGDFKGESHGMARLTESAVIAARELYAKGCKIAALAHRYRVTPAAMGQAIHGVTWKHVKGAT